MDTTCYVPVQLVSQVMLPYKCLLVDLESTDFSFQIGMPTFPDIVDGLMRGVGKVSGFTCLCSARTTSTMKFIIFGAFRN